MLDPYYSNPKIETNPKEVTENYIFYLIIFLFVLDFFPANFVLHRIPGVQLQTSFSILTDSNMIQDSDALYVFFFFFFFFFRAI